MKTNEIMTCLVATLCAGFVGVSQAGDQQSARSADGVLMAQAGPTYQQYDQQRGSDTKSRETKAGKEGTAAAQPQEVNKASRLIGMEVKNEQGEKLGSIKDVVIDIDSGKVSYVVLSAGGFLGVGDKLLAVPLTAFTKSTATTATGTEEIHLVLRADKNSISQAEGIGENWPSVQNPSFGATPFWQQSGEGTQSPRTPTPGMRRGDRETDAPGQFNR